MVPPHLIVLLQLEETQVLDLATRAPQLEETAPAPQLGMEEARVETMLARVLETPRVRGMNREVPANQHMAQ
jgi:hypothetical protein